VNTPLAVAPDLKFNFNSEFLIRFQDEEASFELRDVTLGSPKLSKQELKEAAQRHKDAADTLAVAFYHYGDSFSALPHHAGQIY